MTTTAELRERDLRDQVRRAEQRLAAALGKDPGAPTSTLTFLVAEAVARLAGPPATDFAAYRSARAADPGPRIAAA